MAISKITTAFNREHTLSASTPEETADRRFCRIVAGFCRERVFLV